MSELPALTVLPIWMLPPQPLGMWYVCNAVSKKSFDYAWRLTNESANITLAAFAGPAVPGFEATFARRGTPKLFLILIVNVPALEGGAPLCTSCDLCISSDGSLKALSARASIGALATRAVTGPAITAVRTLTAYRNWNMARCSKVDIANSLMGVWVTRVLRMRMVIQQPWYSAHRKLEQRRTKHQGLGS